MEGTLSSLPKSWCICTKISNGRLNFMRFSNTHSVANTKKIIVNFSSTSIRQCRADGIEPDTHTFSIWLCVQWSMEWWIIDDGINQMSSIFLGLVFDQHVLENWTVESVRLLCVPHSISQGICVNHLIYMKFGAYLKLKKCVSAYGVQTSKRIKLADSVDCLTGYALLCLALLCFALDFIHRIALHRIVDFNQKLCVVRAHDLCFNLYERTHRKHLNEKKGKYIPI